MRNLWRKAMENKSMSENKITMKKKNILISIILAVFMVGLLVYACVPKLGTANFFTYGCVMSIVVIIGSLVAFWLYSNKKIVIHWAYCILASCFGLYFMFMIPVFSVPDEVYTHIIKTYEVSNIMLGIEDDPSDGIVMRRVDEEITKNSMMTTLDDLEYRYTDVFTKVEDSSLIETAHVPLDDAKYQYIVPAVGLSIGRTLELSPVFAFGLGRLFNLIMFVIITTLAIKLIPKHKMLLVTVGLFPMTLQEGMSYSYDAFINAFAFLLFALIIRYSYKEEEISIPEMILLGITLLLLMPTKHFAYFALAFIPLVLFFKDKISKRTKLIIIAVVVIGLLPIVIDKLDGIIRGNSFGTTEQAIEWADGAESYTISYLLANPGILLTIIFNTLIKRSYYYLMNMIGYGLGWLEVKVPIRFVFILFVVLFMNIFKFRDEPEKELPRKSKIIMLLSVIVSVACIFAGMLLAWTPKGMLEIQGVQGRYFIPLVPFAMVVFKTKRIVLPNNIEKYMILAIIVADYIISQYLMIRI